jgi:acetate kinase
VSLDEGLNVDGRGDRDIGPGDAPVRSMVIAAREDLEIAHEVRTALGRWAR